jgi:hypothetical protein
MYSIVKRYYSKKNLLVPRFMFNETCNAVYTKEHRVARNHNKSAAPDNKKVEYRSVWIAKSSYTRAQKRVDEIVQSYYGYTEDEFYLMLGYDILVEEKEM